MPVSLKRRVCGTALMASPYRVSVDMTSSALLEKLLELGWAFHVVEPRGRVKGGGKVAGPRLRVLRIRGGVGVRLSDLLNTEVRERKCVVSDRFGDSVRNTRIMSKKRERYELFVSFCSGEEEISSESRKSGGAGRKGKVGGPVVTVLKTLSHLVASRRQTSPSLTVGV